MPVPYKVGDLVLVKTFPQSKASMGFSAKLAPRYKGPLKVAEFLTPVTVVLRDPRDGSLLKAHVSNIKFSVMFACVTVICIFCSCFFCTLFF